MELIKIENDIAILNVEVNNKIAEFERQLKTIKDQEELLKQSILAENIRFMRG